MTGNLYYDLNGERWTILDFHSKITFSSEISDEKVLEYCRKFEAYMSLVPYELGEEVEQF